MTIRRFFFIVTLIFLFSSSLVAQENVRSQLMHSTFGIIGNDVRGTGFFVGKNVKLDSSSGIYLILVTAKHVLEDNSGDYVKLMLRKKKTEIEYEKIYVNLQIRDNGSPLWKSHPDTSIDVAVIPIDIDIGIDFKVIYIQESLFANDSIFNAIDISPGDELYCLGYPMGAESNDFGFPILRKGILASYPLTPYNIVKNYLFDGEIYSGNSGGPVYLYDNGRMVKDGQYEMSVHFLFMGLLSSEKEATLEYEDFYEKGEKKLKLKIASIVPAQYIKETIDLIK